jgi:hypothetical protein
MMKIRAITSAMHAGWIAARCSTGCIVDDVNEEIVPCPVHAEKIARLAKINEENN